LRPKCPANLIALFYPDTAYADPAFPREYEKIARLSKITQQPLENDCERTSQVNAPERVIQIMRICFVVYAILLTYLVIKMPAQPQAPPNPAFEWFVTGLALFDIAAGFYARRVLRWMVKRSPQSAPKPPPAKQWMTANILSLALFISCGLFGLVLHFVGADVRFVEILLGVCLASLILWRPGTPPAENEGNLIQS
jgi:hypothetical protein